MITQGTLINVIAASSGRVRGNNARNYDLCFPHTVPVRVKYLICTQHFIVTLNYVYITVLLI